MRENRAKGDRVQIGTERIIRSIDKKKDKHSKICTSKGAKDRRIRLSANTAIQFYDVQDRLGYDRPSNVIDWLMIKAKNAIDHLVNVDHYHHLNELLLPNATTSIFNLSEPCTFHSDLNKQDSNHEDRTSYFNYTPVAQDTRPLHFVWNQSFNEQEAFEVVNREPLQSNICPPVVCIPNHEFTNEDDGGLLGFSFEQDIQVQQEEELQENEDDRNYSHF